MARTASLPVLPVERVPASRAPLDGPLELAAEGEPLFDYVLERYPPRVPQAGRLRSVNVLYAAAAAAGREGPARDLVERIRGELGPGRTVWGVKHDDEARRLTGLELYFYDWRRERADLSVARVAELVAPFVDVEAEEPRAIPWHMVSVEVPWVDRPAAGATVGVSLYVDMRSYALHAGRLRFENVYTFHDPMREIDDLLRRIRASVHYDEERAGLATLLLPALVRCHKVCFANKRDGDALYFSRVPTNDVRPVLEARGYPSSLVAFMDREGERLEHLSWDVGIDFSSGEHGALRFRRSGLYGFF
jgi:hypothetical protein